MAAWMIPCLSGRWVVSRFLISGTSPGILVITSSGECLHHLLSQHAATHFPCQVKTKILFWLPLRSEGQEALSLLHPFMALTPSRSTESTEITQVSPEPVKSTDVISQTYKSVPVISESVESTSAFPVIAKSVADLSVSVKPAPVTPESFKHVPVTPDPFKPTPVTLEPIKPTPVTPESVRPVPVTPEPGKPDPAFLDRQPCSSHLQDDQAGNYPVRSNHV